jgi:hypothetical protein
MSVLVSKPSTKRPYHIYTAVLLLWLLFAQATTTLPELSVTFDEPVHITTGYSIWETGDLRLMDDHPPLLELWMSWPLHLSPETPVTEQVSTWELGDRRLFAYADAWWTMPIDSWLIPARVTITLLGVLLGALVFRWATDWFGSWGGLLALALLAFDPNIIAHASVCALDVGIALLIFATMYVFQRMLRRPTLLYVTSTGMLLGLAIAAKISGGVLVPVTSLLMIGWGWQHWERKNILPRYVLYGVTAALTLWSVHLFHIGQTEGIPFTVPAPTFWRSLLHVGGDVSTQRRPSFLFGEMYMGGRWYYFPMAFLLKTPLAVILLTGVSLLMSDRLLQKPWMAALLTALPITYLGISMMSAVNIGYRHILPILPFLYVFIGGVVVPLQRITSQRRQRWAAAAVILLVSWEAVSTLTVWPWHLSYFNEAARGPKNGYRLMTDSNVDWNQAFKAVHDYVEQHGGDDVYFSPFTRFVPLRLYDLEEVNPLPPLPDAPAVMPHRYNPKPGTYIISASTLRGLQVIDPEMYNWFWHREPDTLIANAMLVYHVEEPAPKPAWVAQCSTPVTPLPTEEIKERFRYADLRLLTFDCTQSWIYPQAVSEPGWFTIHRTTLDDPNTFMQSQLAQTELTFEQKISGFTPPHNVYAWTPESIASAPATYHAAPVGWPVAQAQERGIEITSPVDLDGPLTFLGHEVQEQNADLALITYWRVTAPVERPLSLMAHLVNANSQPIAVGDGLGVPYEQLQPGDVIVQRHPLAVPADTSAGAYWLQTGAYWLDSLETVSVAGEDASVDRILLESVPIPQP